MDDVLFEQCIDALIYLLKGKFASVFAAGAAR